MIANVLLEILRGRKNVLFTIKEHSNRTFACGIMKEREPKKQDLKGSFSSLSLRNCKGKVHVQVIKSRGFSEHKTEITKTFYELAFDT